MRQVINTENLAVVISINGYYVQFAQINMGPLNIGPPKLVFESISSENLPAVGNKDYEFEQLGFIKNCNYQKLISLSCISIDKIILQIKTIFETIYNMKFQSYEIDIYEAQNRIQAKHLIVDGRILFGLHEIQFCDKTNTTKTIGKTLAKP